MSEKEERKENKIVDPKKISFIVCTNDEMYERECLLYINSLNIPKGYTSEVLTVQNAKSMAAGYNEAMKASDAKYKVYLHQDTFIRNKNFIRDILCIFKEANIGMIGMVGTAELSNDGTMWNGIRFGAFPRLQELLENKAVSDFFIVKEKYRDAVVIDGLMMITQYDIPWREDLFTGWDFYDASQSVEFLKAGYRVVVAGQKPISWFIHDCGAPNTMHYEEPRKIFLREYADFLHIDANKIRVLFPYTPEIRLNDIPVALTKMGYPSSIVDLKCSLTGTDKADRDLISLKIRNNHADIMISHDFSPSISDACKERGIPYVAWIFDSPQQALYDPAALNDCNFIFSFDKIQYERMKKLGIKHSYYLPLAANVDRIGAVDIKKREEKKLRCEVSFIGQLYKGVQYQQIYDRAQKSTVKRVDEVIKEAFGRWDGINRIYNSLSEEIIEELNQIYGESPLEKYNMDNHMYYENMLITRETAQKERIEMLKRLSKYDLRFYTSDDDIEIPGVKSLPKVEYGEELPKLYYMSKINLNCTLHSIESGIPQRVFDVLAAGGFLLTNYQPELEELFTIGRDLVVYHDFDEMEEKVDYYLHHEKERVRISINGYQKVKERYTYEIQLKKIMNIMERDYGLQKKKMEQWKRI